MERCAAALAGQLTATVWAEASDWPQLPALLDLLRRKAGRVLFNGVPTGVEVCPAQTHGGPYPAASDARFTAVGVTAIYRFVRPVSYQNWPTALLPMALQSPQADSCWRVVDGKRCPPGYC
jgi:2,5-dioxopentanoate dehydrogenase